MLIKTVLPVLAAALALLVASGLNAGEISVYKDKDGVITLTDRPVAADAKIQQVIHYNEKSAAELAEQHKVTEQKRQSAKEQKEALELQDLKEKAVLAREEAEKESALAREKIEATEKYLERYKAKHRSQRRRDRKTAERMTREANEAQARANTAITRANQAQEEVRKASVGPAGQASGAQKGRKE